MHGEISLVGLGTGSFRSVTWGALEALKRADAIVARYPHPAVNEREAGKKTYILPVQKLVEEAGSPAAGEKNVILSIINRSRTEKVVYAVPGHPGVDGYNLSMIKKNARENGIQVSIYPAPSIVDTCYELLSPPGNLSALTLGDLSCANLRPSRAHLITGVEWKGAFRALEKYLKEKHFPGSHSVEYLFYSFQADEPQTKTAVVDELQYVENDKEDVPLGVYVYPRTSSSENWDELVNIMARLRGKQGCVWDRAQTHDSLKRYLLEEAYEVLEAIERGDMHNLREELGDLLLQIVFHARIGEEAQSFDIEDVVDGLVNKLIRRHPHVFGEDEVGSKNQVTRKWEEIKMREKSASIAETVSDIPRALPSLIRAQKVQSKAARVGFDWEQVSGAWAKLEEELQELHQAVVGGDRHCVQEEFGDTLFAAVNVARFVDIDAEECLSQAVEKFIHRFTCMDKEARRANKSLEKMSLEEMDWYWERCKKLQDNTRS